MLLALHVIHMGTYHTPSSLTACSSYVLQSAQCTHGVVERVWNAYCKIKEVMFCIVIHAGFLYLRRILYCTNGRLLYALWCFQLLDVAIAELPILPILS